MIVNSMTNLVEELVGVAALCGQQDAVVGEDPQAGAGVADGLHGVLNLQIAIMEINYHTLTTKMIGNIIK